MTTAIVPMTRLDLAKSRLSGVLDGRTRQRLVLAMFEDVLAALGGCPALDRIVVVTPDVRVAERAAVMGAGTIREEPQHGLNAAIALAVAQVRTAGAPRVLIVPGDIPFATTGEVSSVIAALDDGADVAVVPAHDGLGTNALAFGACRPLAPMFGPCSHARHLAQAHSLGLFARSLRLPGIGHDIDTPDDLRDLASRDPYGRYAFVSSALPAAARSHATSLYAESKETAS